MSLVRKLLLGSPRRRALTLLGMVAIICVVTVELASQAIGLVQLASLKKSRNHPQHYYQPSTDPALAYELRRGIEVQTDDRRLKINALGFREDDDGTFADHRRIAIVGDSVVFGTGVSQDQSISASLQRAIDPDTASIKIINGGTPGYGLGELPAHLRRLVAAYRPETVVYLLNPNDFVIRDTVYEGADNGLYRQYRAPLLKSPWVVRKAIYRLKKGGVSPSGNWYRWTFDGTKSRLLPRIKELAEISAAAGAGFQVVLLPVRGSFDAADATIPDIYREVGAYMTNAGIKWIDPTREFAAAGQTAGDEGGTLIDKTDHLTVEGSRVMAEVIRPLVAPAPVTPAPPAPGS